jgi:hypothetical protein
MNPVLVISLVTISAALLIVAAFLVATSPRLRGRTRRRTRRRNTR